jgi:CheY-like chemotaxis protein
MKSLLLADDRHDLLATLEPVLKHWGYRVLTATDASHSRALLASSSPVLLLIGTNLLNAPDMQLPDPPLPLLALAHPAAPSTAVPHDLLLNVPVDIFTLYSFIQGCVEHRPRQHLRLRVRLPGMYRHAGDNFVLAEVLSLSMNGLFFRSPLRQAAGDRISAIVPLLGHSRELEADGTVVYTVDPLPANNYAQGFAMSFDALAPEQRDLLGRFLTGRLLDEVSACQVGVGDFSVDQLQL